MKKSIVDYVGKKINQLTVVSVDSSNEHFNSNKWLFQCDCGNVISDVPSRVLSGHRKSCGCLKGTTSYVHGCNGDEFYPTWFGMMRRCYNKSNHNYKNYGGRGIVVCDAWHDPKVFVAWARETIGSNKPGYSLDRIDNQKGYCPENCTWSSAKAQANNRRSNALETIDGETKTISEWCAIYNIKPETVRARQKKGMPLKDALSAPVKNSKFKKGPAAPR